MTLRMAIKRSPEVFRVMTEIWEIVNPKNSDAISKEVYTKLNTIWAKEFGLVASSSFLTKDMKIDFVVNTSITF